MGNKSHKLPLKNWTFDESLEWEHRRKTAAFLLHNAMLFQSGLALLPANLVSESSAGPIVFARACCNDVRHHSPHDVQRRVTAIAVVTRLATRVILSRRPPTH